MRERAIGWGLVGLQAILLIALVLGPRGDHWPRPRLLAVAASAAVIAGLVILIVGALGLGRALTPTPEPRAAGSLRTGGLQRFVRHPIYSGVLLMTVGTAARCGHVVCAALAIALIIFFHGKARWEESRLLARYPGYAAYAAVTPRFVPRLRPR